MSIVQNLLDGSYMPHGHCLMWRADLLFLQVAGDLLTATAYFIIPMALIYFVRKKEGLAFNWVFRLFAVFIFLCGVTHTISILNIWNGYYYLAGYAKLVTGLVSVVVAFMVWRLMPEALAIPSNAQLRSKNDELEEARQLLEQRSHELEQLSVTDYLTGATNRRAIVGRVKEEIERLSDIHRMPVY